jgi:predicted ATP-grasp superfamily ATP-dependent carboligase
MTSMDTRPSLPSSVLVHEYVTGGGWAGSGPPSSLARDGMLMLGALLADFRAWGRPHVTTTVDRRLSGLSLPADRVVALESGVYPTALVELAVSCGAALIVAPETDGILERLSALMVDAGVRLLGSSPEAVAVAADKWETNGLFEEEGLRTPETVRAAPGEAHAAAARLGFPLVLKPVSGAGCEGVALVPRIEALERALTQPALRGGGDVILQRYVFGLPASVSLLVSGRDSVALSLNEQRVRPGIPFVYLGGVASIAHGKREEAFDAARRAVSLVPGLGGYVGVDLVLTDDGCSLLEINPRITTSYVGLRRTVSLNMAEAIWRASQEGVLPEAPESSGRIPFNKEDVVGRRSA